jgi:hypothetical protein
VGPYEKAAGGLDAFLKALEFKYRNNAQTSQHVAAARAWVAREFTQRVTAGDLEPVKRTVRELHDELHALHARLARNDATALAELRHPLFQSLQLGTLCQTMAAKTRARCSQHLCSIFASLALCRTVSEMPSSVWSKVMEASTGLAPADGAAVDMSSLWSRAMAMTASISPEDIQALATSVKGSGFQSLLGLMDVAGTGAGAGAGASAGGLGSALAQMLSGAAGRAGGDAGGDAPARLGAAGRANKRTGPAKRPRAQLQLSDQHGPPGQEEAEGQVRGPGALAVASAGASGGASGPARARQRLAHEHDDSDDDSDEDTGDDDSE